MLAVLAGPQLLLQQHRKAEMREAAAPVVAPYVSRSRQEPVQPKPEREAAEATMGDRRALAATDAGSAAPETSMRRAEEQKPTTTEQVGADSHNLTYWMDRAAHVARAGVMQGEAAVLDYESMEIETSTTCPLCKFMRESPCGRHWVCMWQRVALLPRACRVNSECRARCAGGQVTWEKCVAYHKDRGEDFVGPCHHFTAHLGACMAREADSFPPPMRRCGGGRAVSQIHAVADLSLLGAC